MRERRSDRRLLAAATAIAAAGVVALSLPAVWWSPLNVDEEVTMTIASRSYGGIWHIVWGKRGGGPLHFWLEHALLGWPGGLTALRVPSIVFVVLALPAAALVARELAGTLTAAATVLLVAPAPLLVSYASFGRPHVLLAAWLLWATWIGLRAARTEDRRWWVATGIALASSLIVHPTAPLYACALLAVALVYARAPLRELARDAWPGVAAFAVIFVPYYVHSLHVLRARYGVGSGRSGRTYSGHSVFHDAVTTLAPTDDVVNFFSVLALVGLAALLVRRRLREAAVALIVIAAPIVFFTWVPSHGRSAIFFTRYMLPALPFFLMLVAAGCVELARPLGRLRVPALVLAVAVLVGAELKEDMDHLGEIRGLHLGRTVAAVRAVGGNAILFGSTGTIGRSGDIATLSYGRPPVLLDHYVVLRDPGLRRVDDDSCVPTIAFLRRDRGVHTGIWLFYAAPPQKLPVVRGARLVAPGTLLVTARGNARQLIARGERLRRAWHEAVPGDFKVAYLIRADATALRRPRACEPLGEYGNPDITPAQKIPRPTP